MNDGLKKEKAVVAAPVARKKIFSKVILQPGSGAGKFRKGDIELWMDQLNKLSLGNFLVESKSTSKESISVKRSWLEKIRAHARRKAVTPLLVLVVGDAPNDEVWASMPMQSFLEILKFVKEEENRG